MAQVEITLAPLPAHVRTARLVAVAAARRAGLADELVDELRLALGEACSRAVGLHRRHAPGTPVRVRVTDSAGELVVEVADEGPGAGPVPENLADGMLQDDDNNELVDPDVALAVLGGLVDDITVSPGAVGTTVSMRWPLPTASAGTGPAGTAAAPTPH